MLKRQKGGRRRPGSESSVSRADDGPVRVELEGLRREFLEAGGPLRAYANTHWKGNNTCGWHGVTCVQPNHRVNGKLLKFAHLSMNFTETTPPLPLAMGSLRLVQRMTMRGPCRGFSEGSFDEGLSQLRGLTISGGEDFQLGPLRGAGRLKALKLEDTDFMETHPLEYIPRQVRTLRVVNVALSSAKGLEGVTSLSNLVLSGTALSRLSLDGKMLPRLREVRASGNPLLTSIALVNEPWATVLIATNNSLSALPSGLEGASRLKTLDVSFNRITGVLNSTVLPLTTVDRILMTNNKITAFTPAPYARRVKGRPLQCVDVSFNELTALPPWLQDIPTKRLLFQHNGVPHPQGEWRGLAEVPHVVLCEGNPMCDYYSKGMPVLTDARQDRALASMSRNTRALAGLIKSLWEQGYIGRGGFSFTNSWLDEKFRKVTNPCAGVEVAPLGGTVILGCNKNMLIEELWFDKSYGRFKFTRNLPTLPKDVLALAKIPFLHRIVVKDDPSVAVVPPSLYLVTQLQEISIISCSLSEISRNMLEMPNLQKIDVRNNRIRRIEYPRPGRASPRLYSLVLDKNEITELSPELFNLPRLTKLSAKHNSLSALHYPPANGTALSASTGRHVETIDLESNLLREVDLSGVASVRNLVLASNQLTALDRLPSFVRSLLVHHNRLETLDLGDHKGFMAKIIAHHNQLTTAVLPDDVAEADLSYNRLKSVAIKKVNSINLSHNLLAQITVSHMPPHIEYIHAQHNRLTDAVADMLWQGRAYLGIDLSNNLLTRLPRSRGTSGVWQNASRLRSVDISGNSIAGVTSTDCASIYQYFDKSYSEYERKLDLSRNNIVGAYDAKEERMLPVLEEGRSLIIDQSAVSGGDSGLDLAMMATIGGWNNETGEQIVWKEISRSLEGAYDCILERILQNDRIVVRRCSCTQGFYSAADSYGSLECRACVPYARCVDGAISCFPGYYLDLGQSAPRCVSCGATLSEAATCENNRLTPNPGFWRVNNNATAVYACKNPEACGGGVNATSNCRDGHRGSQCSVCAPGYYKTGSLLCEKCPNKAASVIYTLAVAMGVIVAVVGLSCIGDSRSAKMVSGFMDISGADISSLVTSTAQEGAQEISQLVKIGVGFMQVLVALPLVYSVNWDGWLERLGDWFSWVNIDFLSASSVECLMENTPGKAASPPGFEYTFYHSMCVQLAVPLVAVLVSLAAPLAVRVVRHVVRPEHGVSVDAVRSFANRTTVLVMLFAHLPVSTTGSQFFKCVSFDEGATSFIDADLSLQCYTVEWYMYLPVAVAALVVYSLGMPLILIASLAPASVYKGLAPRYALARTMHSWSHSLSKMFVIYRPQYRWWEATELCRKLLVTSVAVHYSREGQLQILAAMVISFVAVVVHVQCQPLRSRYLNWLQTLHLVMVYLTLSVGVLKQLSVPAQTRHVTSVLVVTIDGLLLITMMLIVLIKVGRIGLVLLRRAIGSGDAV